MKPILIGDVAAIKKAKSGKFMFKLPADKSSGAKPGSGSELQEEGFAVYHKGKFYAYANRCKHVPLPLDFGDNDFFTDDKKFLICKNHGALYLPDTGECVAGPCSGAFLDPLPTTVKAGKLYCQISDTTNQK